MKLSHAILTAVGGLALSVFAQSSPAFASHCDSGPPYGHAYGHYRNAYRTRSLPAYVRSHRFVAPGRIVYRQVYQYRDYYTGRVYYGPHHHYHAIYDFPIYTSGRIVYRPHYYCDGVLFPVTHGGPGGYVSVRAPRVGVDVGW